MTKQELKAKQARYRAQNYLAITEQVTQLLEASLHIHTESMRGNIYEDVRLFADKASKVEAAITFQIREWVKKEYKNEIGAWTIDYFECEQADKEGTQETTGTPRKTDTVRSRVHSCASNGE